MLRDTVRYPSNSKTNTGSMGVSVHAQFFDFLSCRKLSTWQNLKPEAYVLIFKISLDPSCIFFELVWLLNLIQCCHWPDLFLLIMIGFHTIWERSCWNYLKILSKLLKRFLCVDYSRIKLHIFKVNKAAPFMRSKVNQTLTVVI